MTKTRKSRQNGLRRHRERAKAAKRQRQIRASIRGRYDDKKEKAEEQKHLGPLALAIKGQFAFLAHRAMNRTNKPVGKVRGAMAASGGQNEEERSAEDVG